MDAMKKHHEKMAKVAKLGGEDETESHTHVEEPPTASTVCVAVPVPATGETQELPSSSDQPPNIQ